MAYQFLQGATQLNQQMQNDVFGQVAALFCECGIQAAKNQTKKPGPNCGRWLDDEGKPIVEKKGNKFGGFKRKAETQLPQAPKPVALANPATIPTAIPTTIPPANYPSAPLPAPLNTPLNDPRNDTRNIPDPFAAQAQATRDLALELVKEKLVKTTAMMDDKIDRMQSQLLRIMEILEKMDEIKADKYKLPRSPGHSQYSDEEYTQKAEEFLASQKAVTQKNGPSKNLMD